MELLHINVIPNMVGEKSFCLQYQVSLSQSYFAEFAEFEVLCSLIASHFLLQSPHNFHIILSLLEQDSGRHA
jgi:hypothetical protein